MLVAYDDGLTRHLAGSGHPESPDRVRVAADELRRRGMLNDRVDTRAALESELARVHAPAYVERAKRECERLDAGMVALLSTGDTAIDATSYEGALHAAGGTLVALEGAVERRGGAFALVRPPGHHAEPARGMGFCLFNNAALAARTFALETGRPALVADIDYHHGNGTQALVDAGLSYVSTHAHPAYPGTGDPGSNRVEAAGTLVNIPIAVSGISTEAFVAIWAHTLRALAERIRPGLVVVSAGFDFVAGDPVGDLGVAAGAARELGRLAREIATTFCEGRALFVLEGGYDPPTLAHCVAETIAGFEEDAPVGCAELGAVPAAQRFLMEKV